MFHQTAAEQKKSKTHCFLTINKQIKRSRSTELLATHPQKSSFMKRLSSTQLFSVSHSKTAKTIKKKSKKKLVSTETKSSSKVSKKKKKEKKENINPKSGNKKKIKIKDLVKK